MSTSSITLGFVALASKSQLSVAVSMAFEVKPKLEEKGFKLSQYARMVALDSVDSISEKTAANYASVAKKIVNKFSNKMDLYQFSAEDVLLFVNFLTSEVAASGYTSSLDDIVAYCNGEPSQKARRLAAVEAAKLAQEAKLQAEQDKQAAAQLSAEVEANRKTEAAEAARLAAEKQAQQAQAEKERADAEKKLAQEQAQAKDELLQAEREAKAEAEAKAAQAEAEAKAAQAEAEAKAEAERKFRESVCIQVRVLEDGAAHIELADNMSPDFLSDVIHTLQAELKRIKKSMLKAA